MSVETVTKDARDYMAAGGLSGWLLYDYLGMNPIFWETVGAISNVTRPCWLWIPVEGQSRLLVSYVDQGRFTHLGIATRLFDGHEQMTAGLKDLLGDSPLVAMEYSPLGTLPRVSRVDAGTIELVRSLGVEVVSSGDLLEYATQRWSEAQLRSHIDAAGALTAIVGEAFAFIGHGLAAGTTEHAIAEFIRGRFAEEGLEAPDGPVVAANEHSSDPHFDPTPETSRAIRAGDWVLIDLWARLAQSDAVFADITWTAYVGDRVPERHQKVFDAVVGGRDAALAALERAFRDGRAPEGWELDAVARRHIAQAGYGEFFNHRLGHSLGREVHGNAVNLDGWETHDTRRVIPGLAVTIEPGVYLPEFGVRSEINVYISEDGPQVTTEVQRSVVRIGG